MNRNIKRHKNCGGFIQVDLKNSFDGMIYGYCSKCKAEKLIEGDMDIRSEEINIYCIANKDNNDLVLNVNDKITLEFETKEDAEVFCKENIITNYVIIPAPYNKED